MGIPIDFHSAILRWTWGIPFIILIWWLTRNLRQDPQEPAEPVWLGRKLWFPLERLDRVSLAVCASIGILFWIGRNSINPYPPDSVYHLLVARRIYETRAIPMWCDWQFYPLGRPHLYPPLFHLLLAGAARLCGGDFLAGFRLVESFMLPFIFFTTWYLVRWLYDAPRAFVALLLIGMDYSLMFTAAMGTPSVLGTSLLSLIIVFFLSGRWLIATATCIVMMYTHMGIAPIALGALAIFSLCHRKYLVSYLAMLIISLIAFLPWYARVYVFSDWFQHPLAIGVYGSIPPGWLPFYKFTWLQFVSVSMLCVVIRAFRGMRWREQRTQILGIVILVSLPMLFSYGGRFYTHTLHLWAALAAGVFTVYLKAPVQPKRILAYGLLALTPTVGIFGTGTPLPPGMFPAPSAWLLAPIVATGALNWINDAQPPGYITWKQARAVAKRIEEVTPAGQPIYFQGDRDLGLVVEWLVNRPTDIGAWEETQPKEPGMRLIDWAAKQDPRACIVSRSSVGFDGDMTVEEIEGLYLGYRAPHGIQPPRVLRHEKIGRKAKEKLGTKVHDGSGTDN